ncbi:methionyl-tRNA formyltransferase [Anaerosporobacter faecicola]|uniref:methionyl-tRNA formyltransferase n=1 Tax=Anaerosporobacter faecicola TaxID=2718714 RepID=UPI00143B1B99|nr:methionyl-tRNA formyltransferase [Anaerosporobacter faecicola]
MKVLFMGTPDFAVTTLEKIIEAGHEVVGVVTQPDKPKGRGKAVLYTPVKEVAMAHGLPIYQPVKVREEHVIEELSKLQPDIGVIVAFGQILPQTLLDMPTYGCVNVHASLLPKYRGAAPIQWSIIDGEPTTGVTIMQMDAGLDTGDMINRVEIPIEKEETGGSLFNKLAEAGADLLIDTLRSFEEGTIVRTKQDSAASTYAARLTKELGNMDFTKSAVVLERLIRGLNPWPSAYTSLNGKTLKVWRADVELKEYGGKPGEIVELTKDAIIVQTGEQALALKEIQLEGKKRMDAGAFLRGFSIEKGTVLGQ